MHLTHPLPDLLVVPVPSSKPEGARGSQREKASSPLHTPSCRHLGDANKALPLPSTSSTFRAVTTGTSVGLPLASLPSLAASPLAPQDGGGGGGRHQAIPHLSSICPQQLGWQLGPRPGQHPGRDFSTSHSQPCLCLPEHISILGPKFPWIN